MKLNKLNAFAVGFTAICLMAFCMDANATKPKPPEPEGIEVEAVAQADAEAVAKAVSKSSSDATVGDLSVDGSGGSATTGDMVSISEHTFYSYAQSDRTASGCFISGDAAGGKSGKFGAFGIYWLDSNCWMAEQAAQEQDVVLNATLKCGGRKYRNAMTWDMKGNKRERTAACIEKVSKSGLAYIEQERSAMQKEVDRLKEQKQTLLTEREADQKTCAASKDRIAEACRK